MSKYILIYLLGIVLANCANTHQNDKDLLIFAASGSRVLCEEILAKDSLNIGINISYASSGTLARQIASGAKAEIYISANKDWIDYLIQEEILKKDFVRCFAENSLALIVPKKEKPVANLGELKTTIEAGDSKLCIGDPAFVPVGKYASEVLDGMNLGAKARENIIFAKDVSSVLRYVEIGECDFGLVYLTEAKLSQKVDVAFVIPDSLHSTIQFFVSNLDTANALSNKTFKLLTDTTNNAILAKNGFTIPL